MRAGVVLLLFWQCFWLNVFNPVHVRGAIQMPGSVAAESGDDDSCCRPTSKSPTPKQKENCAVCFVAKGYTVPPVYVFDLRPSDRVAEQIEAIAEQWRSTIFAFPFYPHGPPRRG